MTQDASVKVKDPSATPISIGKRLPDTMTRILVRTNPWTTRTNTTHGLELLEIPRAAGQVGLLDALRELLCLDLTIRRKRGRILLRGRLLLLLFHRCRLGAAAKKHRRDAVADSGSDGNGAGGGSHLRKHPRARGGLGLRGRRRRGLRRRRWG